MKVRGTVAEERSYMKDTQGKGNDRGPRAGRGLRVQGSVVEERSYINAKMSKEQKAGNRGQ